jgi:cytochrome c556
MTFMRWNVVKIKTQVVKNPASYNKEDVEAAARVIAAIANSGIDKLFKTNSATGKGWKETRVKQEYYQQPDKVKERFAAFTNEANKLAEIASSGDIEAIKPQFNRLFTSCRDCHKSYRKKDK